MMADDLDEILKITAFYRESTRFELHGEKYIRISNEGQRGGLQEWARIKSFYLSRNRPIDDRLFSSTLVDEMVPDYSTLAPLYHFIEKARSSK